MFLFTLVNIGSEKAIKEEVASRYPAFRFAYSRPGFVTFKHTEHTGDRAAAQDGTDFGIELIFARNWGLCFGRCTASELENRVRELSAGKLVHRYSLREADEPSGADAKIGDNVLDVIRVADDEFWLGLHLHNRFRWAQAGANPRLDKPEEAPSRAWLKIEEALRWTGFDIKPGQTALELGSSPGGVSFALLRRGLRVFGVDAAKMSEVCLSEPRFVHLQLEMHQVRDEHIPHDIDYLLCDVNLSPVEVLPQLTRILKLRPAIHTMFYTLKIGSALGIADIQDLLAQIRRWGFAQVKATQLPSNRSEIFVFATQRGAALKKSG